MSKNIYVFFRLIAFELIAAGIISATIATRQNYETVLAISVFIALTGMVFFLSANVSQNKWKVGSKIESFISSRYNRYFLFSPVVFLVGFLFVFEPDEKLTIALAPVFLCVWLVGLEFIWFFPTSWKNTIASQKNREWWFSALSFLLVYGFLAIPAHIPSLLDGIPWNQKNEFVVAVLLIPFVFIINWSFFANRRVMIVLISLLLIKLLTSSFIPQSGLGIRVFTDSGSYAKGIWERSYHTWISPSYTTMMLAPYYSIRELPVEWVNNHFGFNFNDFWMVIEVNGTIHIPDDGRFVLLVRGDAETKLEMIDLDSYIKISPILVSEMDKLDENSYLQIPDTKKFDIKGSILYNRFGEARLEPILVYPDGTIKSAFDSAGVWLSNKDTLTQHQSTFFRAILDTLGLILIGLISSGFLTGLADLLGRNQLSTVDIYLALTSIIAFYIAKLIPKPQLPYFLISLLIIVLFIKTTDYKFTPSGKSFKSYLVSTGIIFLITLMVMDISSLKAMTPFPAGQDGIEYQTFARYIYVYGDTFLAQTPPRAYKVLFPYLVGLLHLFFGQSTSAQFFLNSWCAILSSVLTFQLARSLKLPVNFAYSISVLLLLILCFPASFIFYYRFGLIEPVAILCLLMTLYFASTGKIAWMFISGTLAVLFRLDYIGLTFAAILLIAPVMTGTARQTWTQLLNWMIRTWKLIAVYLVSICIVPFAIILGYFLLIPNYMLNAGDTRQNSLQTIFESLMRVAFGDTPLGLFSRFVEDPLNTLLIAIPLVCGFLIAIVAIFSRKGIFSKLDLRWALLIPAVLPPYIVVRPTGYFPRFSFSLLPLDLIMIGLLIYFFSSRKGKTE